MTVSRAALIAALATTAAWTLKAVAIGLAGGDGRSPLEGPFFLLGLALCVLTSVLLALVLQRRRRLLGKIIGALVSAVVVLGFTVAENVVVNAVAPAHRTWVWGEVNLWVLMLLLVIVAAVLDVRACKLRRDPAAEPVRVVAAR